MKFRPCYVHFSPIWSRFGTDVHKVILMSFLRIGAAKAMLYLGTLLSFCVTS